VASDDGEVSISKEDAMQSFTRALSSKKRKHLIALNKKKQKFENFKEKISLLEKKIDQQK
jgi:hypothetical protein